MITISRLTITSQFDEDYWLTNESTHGTDHGRENDRVTTVLRVAEQSSGHRSATT